MASDLDGTLLPPSLEFTAETIAGVRRLRAAGITFVICTGRMLQSARRMAARLAIEDGLIICYQGALVADLGSGEWLLHRRWPGRWRPMSCAWRATSVAISTSTSTTELFVEQFDDWARRYAEYAEVGVNAVDDLLARSRRGRRRSS